MFYARDTFRRGDFLARGWGGLCTAAPYKSVKKTKVWDNGEAQVLGGGLSTWLSGRRTAKKKACPVYQTRPMGLQGTKDQN